MSVTKVINVEVRAQDVDELNKALAKLEKNIDNTEKKSVKVGDSLSSSLEDAESSAANLSGGLGGAVTEVKKIGAAAKVSGKALKSALITSGVGLLLVLLGELANEWDNIVGYISGANAELEKQKRLVEQIGNELERQKFNNELNLELIELQTKQDVKRAKLAGKTEEEITEIRKQGIKNRIKALEDAAAEALKVEFEAAKAGGEEYEKANKERLKLERAASNERIRLINFELDEQIKDREKANQPQEREKLKPLSSAKTNEEQQQELDLLSKQFEEVFDLEKMQQKALQGLTKETFNLEADNEKVRLALKKKADEETLKNRKILAQQELALIATTAGQAAQILGENTAAGKAFAVAQALINTYQGITNVWSEKAESGLVGAGLAQRIATTAIVAAQGFAAVKDILSVKVPGGFSGGAGGNSAGARGGAPSFNVVGTSGVNQLAESLQQDQQPVQAFVVGSNVTSQQALDRNITETATLG